MSYVRQSRKAPPYGSKRTILAAPRKGSIHVPAVVLCPLCVRGVRHTNAVHDAAVAPFVGELTGEPRGYVVELRRGPWAVPNLYIDRADAVRAARMHRGRAVRG